MAHFNGLTFTAVPVTTGFGATLAVNAALTSGTVIAGILDPANGVHRIFNPETSGLPVVSGTDTAATWLPTLNGAPSPVTVNDQYWASVPGSTQGANNKIGQISIPLTPAAKDTVNASSTLVNTKVSAQAIVITASGTF